MCVYCFLTLNSSSFYLYIIGIKEAINQCNSQNVHVT